MVKTNSIERISRYSTDGSEYMWTDYIIDISCVYSPGTTSYPVSGNSAWVTDEFIKFQLMQPRCPLTFINEAGVALVDIQGSPGSTIDCSNGPTPIACTIQRIVSLRMFNVRYIIKASIIDCPEGTEASPIASSRYSRTESINDQDRSVMVTHGYAFFRSNVLAAMGTSADAYRGYLIPPCPLGYKRDSIIITLDQNGIFMEFTCTDSEQMIDIGGIEVPGSAGSIGIKDMGLIYTANPVPHGSLGFAGMASISRVVAWAKGNKATSTYTMYQFLYATAIAKLGDAVTGGYLVDASIEEDVFNKSIKMSLGYQLLAKGNAGVPDVTLGIKGFVGSPSPEKPIVTLPDTNGINPVPPFSQATRGTAAYQLAVSSLATACFTNPESVGQDLTGQAVPPDLYQYKSQNGFSSVAVYDTVTTPDAKTYTQKAKQNSRSAGDSEKSSYINYSIKTSWETDKGIRNYPIATPASSGSPGEGYQSGFYSEDGNSSQDNEETTDNPSSIDVQVFQPNTNKTVTFIIERVGCVPEIPNPKPSEGSTGYTLLGVAIAPIGIEIMPDGYTIIYRASGTYTYSTMNAKEDDDSIPFDIPPWVKVDPSEFTQITQQDYVDGIINNEVV